MIVDRRDEWYSRAAEYLAQRMGLDHFIDSTGNIVLHTKPEPGGVGQIWFDSCRTLVARCWRKYR